MLLLGDSVSASHISPVDDIKVNSTAGNYLKANGVDPKAYNSYDSRLGNLVCLSLILNEKNATNEVTIATFARCFL
ncbi:hypothetical protein L3i20_v218480 [Paenibacillus sp. L3-i20]|nr:hypothetical protein L3i20_v218480 [Paenibacillus sp. L3-i20]